MIQLSHQYTTTGKTIALSRWTFASKVLSLHFNKLSKFVTDFLPRSKHLLILWVQSPSTVIWEPKKIKSVTVSIVSPCICHEVKGPDAMILVFWMLSFKPTLSLSSFTFIKRLFSSSSLSTIRVVSSAYLRLLIFLPAILIPACASSSPAFLMMYFAYKLNQQGDSLDILLSRFGTSLLFHVCSNCCFLYCIQVSQEADKVVWYSYFFKNLPQFIVIHTVKCFSIANEAEVDVFFFFFFSILLLFLWSNRCWQFDLWFIFLL